MSWSASIFSHMENSLAIFIRIAFVGLPQFLLTKFRICATVTCSLDGAKSRNSESRNILSSFHRQLISIISQSFLYRWTRWNSLGLLCEKVEEKIRKSFFVLVLFLYFLHFEINHRLESPFWGVQKLSEKFTQIDLRWVWNEKFVAQDEPLNC